MKVPGQSEGAAFGGPWTKKKLDVLERYLEAYTTALKHKPFQLWYIDAFAGTGNILTTNRATDEKEFLAGSARRALEVSDRPFDRLVFVEKEQGRCAELDRLCADYPDRSARVENAEANTFLRQIKPGTSVRGVLFLDPFATEVEMQALEHVASLRQFDTRILFPAGAVARILPRDKRPESVSPKWAECLDRVYGNGRWRELYRPSPQSNLFNHPQERRDPGVAELSRIYQERLQEVFGSRLLRKTALLRNSQHAVLFEFIFCVGHPAGIGPAKRIAEHLLTKL